MRRPDVCNRSPTRAPCVLSDSLSLSRAQGRLRGLHQGRLRGRREGSGRASLDGDLRLRADGVRSPPRPPGGEAMVMIGRCSVLAGAVIDSPSGSAPRRRLDSATRRGRDPTSDALCHDRDPRPALARRPFYASQGRDPGERHPRASARRSGTRPPDPLPPPSRQRGRPPRIRTSSIDECSPLSPVHPAHTGCGEGARHRIRDFAAADRLPALLHPSSRRG